VTKSIGQSLINLLPFLFTFFFFFYFLISFKFSRFYIMFSTVMFAFFVQNLFLLQISYFTSGNYYLL
jgi:mannose/fructose/N-acetylgalactosamine-specific phosphotransferase system component IID